jgi:small subunit ribosomal protein S17
MEECHDKRCPVHSDLKLHRSVIEGIVVSDKAKNTVVVERGYTVYIKKYERNLRKRSKLHAHNPECINARTGDTVKVVGTRRLSKTKSFVVTEILAKGSQ